MRDLAEKHIVWIALAFLVWFGMFRSSERSSLLKAAERKAGGDDAGLPAVRPVKEAPVRIATPFLDRTPPPAPPKKTPAEVAAEKAKDHPAAPPPPPPPAFAPFRLDLTAVMAFAGGGLARLNGHRIEVGQKVPGLDAGSPPVLTAVRGTTVEVTHRGRIYTLDLAGRARIEVVPVSAAERTRP